MRRRATRQQTATGNNSDYVTAFQSWLNSICTAYNGKLPSGVTPTTPYILYETYIDGFGTPFIQPLLIYAHNTSDVGEIMQVVDDLDGQIGEGGYLLNAENVNARIRKGSPFYQNMQDERENVKAGYVNLIISIYQKER